MAQKNWDAAFFLEAAFQEGLRVIFYRGRADCSNSRLPWKILPSRVDVAANLRALAHDLSNSLETVLQAAYLLQAAKLDGQNQKWAQMIDAAARDAARINREIRKILNTES